MISEIALLIPHYNDLVGLAVALKSVTNLTPVDVIVVDDGSSIKPQEDLLRIEYPQINFLKVINLPKNQGIEVALNAGLSYIVNQKYKYTARLDCKDYNHPERFVIQKDFLDKNMDVSFIGTWTSFFDYTGKELYIQQNPENHKDILNKIFITCPFVHPSIMFRTEILEKIGFYSLSYKFNEDYDFYFKVLKYYKAANICQVLVYSLVDVNGITFRTYRKGHWSSLKIKIKYFKPSKIIPFSIGVIKHIIGLIGGTKIYRINILIQKQKFYN